MLYQCFSHLLSSEELHGYVVLCCSPRVFPGVTDALSLEYLNIYFFNFYFLFHHPEEKAGFEQETCTGNNLSWERVIQRSCAVTGQSLEQPRLISGLILL